MKNKKIESLLKQLENLKKEMEVLCDNLYEERKEMTKDDEKYLACSEMMMILENEDSIMDLKNRLSYFTKDIVCKGQLKKNSRGRFILGDMELSCNSKIEVYDTNTSAWFYGKVQYSNDAYYFEPNGFADNKCLYEGMKVRVRG